MQPIPQQHRSKIFIGLIVVGCLVALIWFKKAITAMIWPEAPQQVYQTAEPAKGMSDPPTETVTMKVPLKTYKKEKALKKGVISPESAVDPKKALLKTATIDPSESAHTVSVLVDEETGNTTIEAKEEPRSWYAFGGDGAVGIRGGVGVGGITGTVYARQKLIRILDAQVSAYAEISGSETRPVDAKAMIDIEVWRWR